MKTLKRVIWPFVAIVNLPFIFIVFIYVVIKVYLNSSAVDIGFMEDSSPENSPIINIMKTIYPKHLSYFVAVVVYTQLILKLWT